MLGSDIITKFEALIDDTLDETLEYQLLNDAKNEVEQDLLPVFLQKSDTSHSTAVGQTYTTAIPLPSDFYLGVPYIYVNQERFYQVPFGRAVEYQNTWGFYYVDLVNQAYHLCGTQTQVSLITFTYLYQTPDVQEDTSPVWPQQFHSIIPLKMVEMWYAIDQGEKMKDWTTEWASYYQDRLNKFRDYDQQLKLANMGGTSVPFDAYGVPSENKLNGLNTF